VAPELRVATPADVPALAALIERAVRGLSTAHYDDAQIEGALRDLFGVDSQLVADGSYYLIAGDAGAVAAAGGWSARRTLYGGDQAKAADDPRLDPATEPARIRAFFVDPAWARRGLARRLYAACERAAVAAGFRRFELVATLPGVPLYRALGFEPLAPVTIPLAGGLVLPCVRMGRGIHERGTGDG
jgi:GNAT superfamily N-acetyltransferase